MLVPWIFLYTCKPPSRFHSDKFLHSDTDYLGIHQQLWKINKNLRESKQSKINENSIAVTRMLLFQWSSINIKYCNYSILLLLTKFAIFTSVTVLAHTSEATFTSFYAFSTIFARIGNTSVFFWKYVKLKHRYYYWISCSSFLLVFQPLYNKSSLENHVTSVLPSQCLPLVPRGHSQSYSPPSSSLHFASFLQGFGWQGCGIS